MGSSAQAERRHVPRRPFRGSVELAMPEDTEAYEADGVDLSIGGMALRTSLLPDRGSELACRFELEDGRRVTARGEVVWSQDAGSEAGEFGLRFTELTESDEDAIRESIRTDPSHQEPSPASQEPSRARLHIPGMNAPLRARIRTEMEDAIVLGSDLSFLKLGEPIEVERHEGKRERGRIEDVTIEVDDETRIARLMLTVVLPGSSRTAKHRALSAPIPEAPIALEKKRGAHGTAMYTPAPSDVLLPPCPPGLATPLVARHALEAERDEVQHDVPAREHDLEADDAGAHEAMDEERADAITSTPPSGRTPPAWLVSTIATIRTVTRAIVTKAGPLTARVFSAIIAFVMLATKTVRARIKGTPVEVEAPRPTSGRRPQNPAMQREETEAEARPRRKIGLYVLAGAGLLAIVYAVATSGKDPRPRTPRPQVAVAPASEPPTAETAADPNATAANGASADPNAAPTGSNTTPTGATGNNGPVTGEPPMGANMPANIAGPDDMTPTPRRGAAAAPRTRTLPTDLIAASHSRNANVDTDRPTIRGASPAARAAAVAPQNVPRVASPAPAPVATAHVIGSPAVRTGTILRIRMDGAITGIAGGPGAGNTIVIRIPGRRSLDLGAPLVRQDARLMNAGVYNRGGSAELSLRFREAVPQFQARVRGSVLEIVLAPAPVRRAALNARHR